MEQLELERSTARNMVVAGSMGAGIALFVVSITIMLAVGLLLGALVIIERTARRCNEEPEEWSGTTPARRASGAIGELA
ncbi:MAG: hypothetical protein JWQ98_704 [Chlorobi bacterium]|nr:hypothetical protein [Chlorobiota bacterium]